jgi:carboxypeptidase C (cathepsin A)
MRLAPTSAMVDVMTRPVGWKVGAHCEPLNPMDNQHWEKNGFTRIEHASDLREALAMDPKLKALIAHGYDDLSCASFGSVLEVSQSPAMGAPNRLQVKVYPSGHMVYSRPESQAALRREVMVLCGL